jgi:hypothetical protein
MVTIALIEQRRGTDMKITYEIERDKTELGQEFGGWKVTRFTKHGWQVVFRGDFAEAHEFIEELRSQIEQAVA